jgi:hypothetical protein
MSPRVLLSHKLRLATLGVVGTMFASTMFPSALVLADAVPTAPTTSDTSSSTSTLAPVTAPITKLASSDATAINGVAVTDHSASVSAGDIATTLAHDGGVLAASDQTKTTSDSGSAIKAVTAGVSVYVPKVPSHGVTIGATRGPNLEIQLPNADNAQDAKQIAPGTVAYPSNDGAANAVQATENGGVRMLTIIDNPNAPVTYGYKVTVPDGGKIILKSNGGAAIVDGDGNLIASVDTPWAHDATGKAIKTYFTTDGTNLVQHIEHNVPGIVYPVTADPWVRRISWWGYKIYIDSWLMHSFAGATLAGAVGGIIAQVCTPAVLGSAGIAVPLCAGGITGVGWLVWDVVSHYWKDGRGIELRFTWNGWLVGWSRY